MALAVCAFLKMRLVAVRSMGDILGQLWEEQEKNSSPRWSSSVLIDPRSFSESSQRGFSKALGMVHWLGLAEGSSESKSVMRSCSSVGMGRLGRRCV